MKKKKWLKRLSTLLILLVVGELFARFFMGLGDIPIYVEHPAYEYIFAPNQVSWRYGNRIATNSYSMRSGPLSNGDRVRILKIGDSIINGGNHVDNDSLSSAILERQLQQSLQDTVRVLNISASSWGPDNAAAYLNTHGHFDASMMVVVFSSHDYHDNMHHRKVVGVHQSWPDKKPMSALTDGFSRYIWPKIRGVFSDYDEYAYIKGFDDSAVNPGWLQLRDYAQQHQMELLVYIHPEKEENKNQAFNANGQALIQMLKDNGIQPFSGLETGLTDSDYRDHIHLNDSGQRKMAQFLRPYLEKHASARL